MHLISVCTWCVQYKQTVYIHVSSWRWCFRRGEEVRFSVQLQVGMYVSCIQQLTFHTSKCVELYKNYLNVYTW